MSAFPALTIMKYLHENNTDGRSLSDIIDAVDSGESFSSSVTYGQVAPHPWKHGNALAVTNYVADNYLTSNEVNALDDPAHLEDVRTSGNTMNQNANKIPEYDHVDLQHNTSEHVPYFSVIAKFLDSIPQSAFDVNRGVMSQSTSYESNTSKKWLLQMLNDPDYRPSISLIAKRSSVFTMNTIESSNGIAVRSGDPDLRGWACAVHGVFWTILDHPNNPYFEGNNQANSDAIRLRALSFTLVDMIMRQSLWMHKASNGQIDEWYPTRWAGFDSYRMGYVLNRCWDSIPKMVQPYVDQMIDKMLTIVDDPRSNAGTQTDMDGWKVGGSPLCAGANGRRFLDYQPKVEHIINQILLWGNIIDNHMEEHDGGVDISYNGLHIMNYLALRIVGADNDFSKTPLQKWGELQMYQGLPDPYRQEGISWIPYMSYTGCSIGTPGGLDQEQRDFEFKSALMAYYEPELFGWRGWSFFLYRYMLRDSSSMTPYHGEGMDAVENDDSPIHTNNELWLFYQALYLEEVQRLGDVWQTLWDRKDHAHAYVHDGDDDNLKQMFARDGNFVKLFGDETGKVAMFKYDNWGGQCWNVDGGFRVQPDKQHGMQGSVCAVWTKDSGNLILARAAVSQGGPDENPNIYEMDRFMNNQILGELQDGTYFCSSSTTGGSQLRNRTVGGGADQQNAGRDTRDFTLDDVNNSFHIEISNNFNPMRSGNDPFTAIVEKQEIHDIDASGWSVEKHILNTGGETRKMKNLKEQFPLVLKGEDMKGKNIGNFSLPSGDAMVVSYSTGGGFTTLNNHDTWINAVKVIKLSRYSGSMYIVLDPSEHSGGLSIMYESMTLDCYRSLTCGKLSIDMHPNRGSSITIPSDTVIKYKIQPTAP